MKRRFLLGLTMLLTLLPMFVGVWNNGSEAATILTENFDSGGKTAYTAANVTLGSGSWYLNEALTGNSSSDRRTGAYSARVRAAGSLRMNFNANNAGTVSIQHAKFGSDGTSGWELYKSNDNGASWSRVGGTINSTSTNLSTVNFTVNSATAVRFEIRKVSGGANRINFDNISIGDYVGSTPTPTPTPIVTPTPVASSSVHLTMGNPSNAATDINLPDNYLMVKPQYALAYSKFDGRPHWVSWHLASSWFGSTPRQDSFRADTMLPSGWYRVQSGDYSGSGYDRGHLCPSADRTRNVADNDATFLMTNMMPQAPTNNQQTWAGLETYSRTLANAGNELYIIAGSYGVSGYIANGNVGIPTYTWKVIMVLPNGTKDVERVDGSTRLIAVWMPNTNDIGTDWRDYRVSTDYLESLTGYDFFSNVPTDIQAQIESQVDTQFVGDWEFFIDKAAIAENEAAATDKK